MIISRKISILLAVSIVIGFFGIGAFLLEAKRAIPSQSAQQSSQIEAKISIKETKSEEAHSSETENALLTLNKFYRSKTEGGKIIWEAQGEQGSYFPAEKVARIEQASLLMTREDKPFKLNAGRAELSFGDTGGLLKADGSAGVTVLYGNTKMESDTANYDNLKSIVRVPGRVRIAEERIEVTGSGLTAELEKEVFIIEKNVESVIKPLS
jgi:LPS export ABC transporter protein LptC